VCQHVDEAEGKLDRRTLIVRGGAAIAAASAATALPWPAVARGAVRSGEDLVLQTVRGPVTGSSIHWALAHEHFFVDFLGPNDPAYTDVDWTDVTATCVASAQVLRAQGVDLFMDWTNLGVGRNVLLLRDVSRQTGMNIVCATGIYKSLVPPQFERSSVDEIAEHFYGELAGGIDGTPVRAGWIKITTTESGPTASDGRIHRAAAMAAKKAGATISLHSPFTEATLRVVKTLEDEGFDLRRFVWGHAQPSPVADHIALAKRGAMIQYDAISAQSDPFFHGPTDDASMLDRIEAMVQAGFGDRVMVSADASVFVNPAIFQYDRNNAYVFGTFAAKLRDRIGGDAARMVLRDNVIHAFRRGSKLKA
jgi:predicted metal-dependent phosphotriesterase family hydrolase